MSYRKIKVDGVQYQYVTGKTHTKVKGIGVVESSKIGSWFWRPCPPCGPGCNCDPYEYFLQFRVTPKNVAELIKIFNEHGMEAIKRFDKIAPPEGFVPGRVYLKSDVAKTFK